MTGVGGQRVHSPRSFALSPPVLIRFELEPGFEFPVELSILLLALASPLLPPSVAAEAERVVDAAGTSLISVSSMPISCICFARFSACDMKAIGADSASTKSGTRQRKDERRRQSLEHVNGRTKSVDKVWNTSTEGRTASTKSGTRQRKDEQRRQSLEHVNGRTNSVDKVWNTSTEGRTASTKSGTHQQKDEQRRKKSGTSTGRTASTKSGTRQQKDEASTKSKMSTEGRTVSTKSEISMTG